MQYDPPRVTQKITRKYLTSVNTYMFQSTLSKPGELIWLLNIKPFLVNLLQSGIFLHLKVIANSDLKEKIK
jgi:hypothetical protein